MSTVEGFKLKRYIYLKFQVNSVLRLVFLKQNVAFPIFRLLNAVTARVQILVHFIYSPHSMKLNYLQAININI